MIQIENYFKNESTKKAFYEWLKWDNGIEEHPDDYVFFYEFVNQCFINSEIIDKKTFVKLCKTKTHTSRKIKFGICQRYYIKYYTIMEFLKWKQTNSK